MKVRLDARISTLYAVKTDPPLLEGAAHDIITLSADTVVVGASGASGLNAQSI